MAKLWDKYASKPNELSSQDIQMILQMHNDARARYKLAPLTWDEGLARTAKQWADTCYWGHSKHSDTQQKLGAAFPGVPNPNAGENLSTWTGPPKFGMMPGQYGTKLWLDEEQHWDCVTNTCRVEPCGHMTQAVWEDTKQIGCALRTCEDGLDPRSWPGSVAAQGNKFAATYLVCHYSPPGNYVDHQRKPLRPMPVAKCWKPGDPVPTSRAPPAPSVPSAPSAPFVPSAPAPATPSAPAAPISPGLQYNDTGVQYTGGDLFAGLARRPVPVRTTPSQQPLVPSIVTPTPPATRPPTPPPTATRPPATTTTTTQPTARPPVPEPFLSSAASPTPSVTQSAGPIAGASLAGAALLGAAAGAIWFFALDNNKDARR